MSKRNYEAAFKDTNIRRIVETHRQHLKKHTLDSDEEDDGDEDNVLDVDDIEGEEDGIARQEGEQKMTAFNMTEEMEEGHFDKDGHFIWKNEKEIRDNWLDNIDWQRIKTSADSKGKYDISEKTLGDESGSDSETEENFDEVSSYKKMLEYMKPGESVNKALKRLGGADMKLSSVERLKRKKAGTLTSNEDVTNLTELANQILTNVGNMDIYQETYEQIKMMIDNRGKKSRTVAKEAELDMYADDFDVKEKQKISVDDKLCSQDEENEVQGPMWEFKWKIEDEQIHGPFSTGQMIKWTRENYFKSGVMVRKFGENSNFYNSSRIDFELYE